MKYLLNMQTDRQKTKVCQTVIQSYKNDKYADTLRENTWLEILLDFRGRGPVFAMSVVTWVVTNERRIRLQKVNFKFMSVFLCYLLKHVWQLDLLIRLKG